MTKRHILIYIVLAIFVSAWQIGAWRVSAQKTDAPSVDARSGATPIVTSLTIDGRVTVDSLRVARAGSKFSIAMDLVTDRRGLKAHEAVVLTPVLKDNTHRHEFPGTIIAGRDRIQGDLRAVYFGRPRPYDHTKSHTWGTIHLDQTIAYQTWMFDAQLWLVEKAYTHDAVLIKTDSVAMYRPKQIVAPTVVAKFKTVKDVDPVIATGPVELPAELLRPAVPTPIMTTGRHTFSDKAFIDFQVGRAELLPEFKNNASELARIMGVIAKLNGAKNIKINSVSICGYSSPEGSVALNTRLSAARSESMRRWLVEASGWDSKLFKVTSVPEDWDGLKTWVQYSDFVDKLLIVNAIDNSGLAPDALEARLKDFDSYRRMLREIYPKLRRVEYTINYTIGR